MSWLQNDNRMYFGFASMGLYWLIGAVVLWALANSPIGALPNWPAKSPLENWLRYVSILFLILGFRANQSLLMAAHFVFAVFAAWVPLFFAWSFVILHMLMTVMLSAIAALASGLGAENIPNPIGAFFALYPMHARTSAEAVLICTLLLRLVFDQKRRYVMVAPKTERKIAVFLTVIGGLFGLHRIYYRRYRSGILYVFTLGLLGIGTLRDLIELVRDGTLDSITLDVV